MLNEVIDDAKKGKRKSLLFKIDFAKAYDSVDWVFLEAIMKRFNFYPKWVAWVMDCVSSTSASVLINGSPWRNSSWNEDLGRGTPYLPSYS